MTENKLNPLEEAQVRRDKLAALAAAGIPTYAASTERTATVAEALENYEAWSGDAKSITLAGRIMTIRVHGGLLFFDLRDASGKLQGLLKLDAIGEESFNLLRDRLDSADFIQATGTLFTTNRGEKTLQVTSWKLLGKALLPLPDKFHGLKDIETRYRQRELDLIANPEVMQRFLVRSKLVSSLRHFLDQQGFIEVETPMMQTIPGGANARPFVTHHHALDIDLYMRIAPELYLKRLIVGGFEKVYEIGRCFRNEGIDYAHNPEFTMIELYWAYASKESFVAFLETMITTIVQASVGTMEVTQETGEVVNFMAPYPRMTFRDAIMQSCGIDIDALSTQEDIEKAAQAKGMKIDFSDCHGYGECADELYKKTARQAIMQPTWVFDYPAELKPLAGVDPEDPRKSASCQLVVMGAEVVNAYYHELTDPIVQRKHFEAQQALREQGSEVAQRIDEDFLAALEHGMPPTSGMGFGIDRLCAFLTGAPNLKEVILFPTMRPENPST